MSGEELTAALRRSRRRPGGHLDKQVSCDSQDLAESEAALERVRFDDNVSFIEAISPDTEADKHRPSKVRTIIFRSQLVNICDVYIKVQVTQSVLRFINVSVRSPNITATVVEVRAGGRTGGPPEGGDRGGAGPGGVAPAPEVLACQPAPAGAQYRGGQSLGRGLAGGRARGRPLEPGRPDSSPQQQLAVK